MGDDERVGEHRRRAGELAAGSVGREEGRRRGLRGSLGAGGGCSRANGHTARLSSLGGEKERVKTSLSSRERSRRSRAREGARRGRPARHGVAVALRRPSLACAQGTAPRGEAERMGGAVWESPVASCTNAVSRGDAGAKSGDGAWLGRRRTGEGVRKERVERERDLSDSKFESFSKFSINTRKILNTKAVPNFEPYHFCFRLIYIWGSVQKF